MIRLPDGMRDRLAQAAAKAGRSVNAEVVARLEASFTQNDIVWELEDRLDRIENFVYELQKNAGVERGHPSEWYTETDKRLQANRDDSR